MSVKVNFSNMTKEVVGEQGISEAEFLGAVSAAKLAHEAVENGRGKGMQEWMLSPYNQDEVVARINETAAKIRESCEYFVVLGIGGSALGPIAVFNALKHLFYNELPRSERKGPKFYVMDNIDPVRMNNLFQIIDLEKTVFNVITKSGSTSETMSQYLIVFDMLKQKLGKDAHKHIIATTSQTTGNLVKLAKENNFETFYIPDGVGGRFSELSPVGLLPAAVVGIDIAALLAGARSMDERCKSADLKTNPALTIALLQYLSMKKGKNINVILPYSDNLKYIADWYGQIWAESLGKEFDKQGKLVNVGQTPVKALGVTDQHSQVQLYNEGPYDKVITFLEVRSFQSDVVIPQGCEDYPNVNFLCGHTLQELLKQELRATRYNLTKRGRPNLTVILEAVDEFHIGELLYMFQLQTSYTGELLNINTYNQPGVEGGKNATYALLGRKGYEELAQTIANDNLKGKDYIID